MRKCVFFATAVALILFFHATVFAQELPKIGVIDLQRCLHESMEGKKATELLKKKKAELQRKLDKKQQELLEMRQEFEKQSMMLSMDAQENKRKDVERKTRELEYYLRDLNEEMTRAEEREKKRIFGELGTVIEELGGKGGYELILEKRAGGVLYRDQAVDITDQVIKAYDKLKQGQGKKAGE